MRRIERNPGHRCRSAFLATVQACKPSTFLDLDISLCSAAVLCAVITREHRDGCRAAFLHPLRCLAGGTRVERRHQAPRARFTSAVRESVRAFNEDILQTSSFGLLQFAPETSCQAPDGASQLGWHPRRSLHRDLARTAAGVRGHRRPLPPPPALAPLPPW